MTMQIGILLTHRYRLLSVAAIIDVFETVNLFYAGEGKEPPFQIGLFFTGAMKPQLADRLDRYTIQCIAPQQQRQDLIFIPAFNSENMQQTLFENREYIPWLRQQFAAGAEIASYCTGAFLLGATGLLDGLPATTHIDACPAFAASFPAVHLKPDRIVTG